MQPILVLLGIISIAIATIALYCFLIKSFFVKHSARERTIEKRKIIKEKARLFLSAMLLSELLGIFFLSLADSIKGPILIFQAAALMLASCLCSFLTLYNAVKTEKIDLYVREGLQFGTLFFCLFLIRISLKISGGFDTESAKGTFSIFVSFFSSIYFATSVIAVALIFCDAVKTEAEYITRYLILVIIIGIVVGSALMLAPNYWTLFF